MDQYFKGSTWLLIGVAVILLSFLGWYRFGSKVIYRSTIKAGPVVAEPTGTHSLRSSFTIKGARSLETLVFQGWIESEGHAGACIYADASAAIPALRSAQSDKDCSLGFVLPKDKDWAISYFEGACWVRGPEREYCVKSTLDNKDKAPYALGTHLVRPQNTVPVESMYTEIRSRRGNSSPFSIRWATIACLNPIDPSTSTTAFTCRPNTPGPDPMRRLGPIATIP